MKTNIKNTLLIFTFIFGFTTVYGQYAIVGETNVDQGQTYTYTMNQGNINYLTWMVPFGGNIISQNTETATIQWTASSGGGLIVVNGQDFFSNSIDVSLQVIIGQTAPSTPSTPIVQSTTCGTVILERTSTPPIGTTWYWQSSPTGEDISDSESTITVTSGTIYYLRAKYNGGLWSDNSSSVNFTVQEMLMWYADTDGDGLGDSNTSQSSCDQPAGYVNNNSDQCPNESGTAANNGCPATTVGSTSLTLTPNTIRENFDGSGHSVAIDLDNDDDIDIVSTANIEGIIVWFENDGHEKFTERVIANVTNAWNFIIIDIDNDGDLDIWATGVDSNAENSISIWFENDGNQHFTRHNILDMFGVELAYPADFNGDGIVDFVEYDYNPNDGVDIITWYEGVPNQDYIRHTTIASTEANLKYIRFPNGLDYDKDDDFAVKDTITNEFFFLENKNGLSFEKHLMSIDIVDEKNLYFGSAIDLDKDGDLDLPAFSDILNQVYWYENKGNYNFTKHTIDTANAYPFSISSSDINNDGFTDIVVSSYLGNQLVGYLNDGSQIFTKQDLGTVSGPVNHAIVDLDDDNDNDFIVNGYIGDNVTWFKTKICNPKAQANLSQDQNYIYSSSPRIATTNIDELTCRDELTESVTYFDGLGRPKQQIGIGQSPDGNDIISHIAYDEFGRQAQDFLPYVPTVDLFPTDANDGSFRADSQSEAIDTYYQANYNTDLQGHINPYSKKSFEASPLNRVLEQAAPGSDWSLGTIDANTGYSDGHTIKFDYQSNTTTDKVKLFKVVFQNGNTKKPTLSLTNPKHYAVNQLYKTSTKDENWSATQDNLTNHTTEEFKDKQGRVILKRTYTNAKKHDTYYVYDDFGNLTYVLPPKVKTGNGVDATELKELCYQYKYDERNRLIRKKIPSKGWESIVYDKLDRPILTQTKNLKDTNKWLFTKYDAFGRVVYTGKYKKDQSRNQLQNQADTYTAINQYEVRTAATSIGDASVNYTHRSFPENNLKVLSINYYDDYNFNLDGGTNPIDVLGVQITTNTKSLATASQVRVLGENQWINTVSYYDKKARPIYSYSKNNYLNTVDITKTQLDFIGNVIRTVSRHTKGTNPTIKTVDRFRYDHANRLLTHKQQINHQDEELIAKNEYDELGQLINKGVGNVPLGKQLQTIDYTYNIRGWLKGINDAQQPLADNLFAFQLNYNSTTGSSELDATPLYNGNISETIWRTANDNKKRAYGYKYDALNRIKRANYRAGDTYTEEQNFFNIFGLVYDKNGNIKQLKRKSPKSSFNGSLVTDHLEYSYFNNGISNRLKSVKDISANDLGFKDGNTSNDDYLYDQDGNLTSDKNKGIKTIKYNHLNMPTKIVVDGNGNKGRINYVYTADGIKLQKRKTEGGVTTTTDYAGNFVYEDGDLKQISHTEGYLEQSGNTYQYVYYLTDIWRNTRVTFADVNGNGIIEKDLGEIKRTQNFYPFGLEHANQNKVIVGVKNNLKTYQGQEFTEDLGLNTHEWKYRMSDPAIGRFWQVDPLAQDYTYNSTYAFQENKMGMGVELEGLEITDFPETDEQWQDGLGSGVSNESANSSYSFSKVWKGIKSFFTDKNPVTVTITGPTMNLKRDPSSKKITGETLNIDTSDPKSIVNYADKLKDIVVNKTTSSTSSASIETTNTSKDSTTFKIVKSSINPNSSKYKDAKGKINPLYATIQTLKDTTVSNTQMVNAVNSIQKKNEKVKKQSDSIIEANN